MSPEQATGDRVIDGRSDIYSLGALTYEMLTGEPPHTGSTSQAIIARMLTEKPRPMRATRSSIPEHVEFAVQHSLEKLPADRFSTAGQFAEALRGHATGGTTGLHQFSLPQKKKWSSRLKDPVVIGLAAIAVAAAAFAGFRRPQPTPERVTRFVVATTDSTKAGATFPWPGAISPDGYTVVYLSSLTNSLMAIRTDELDPRPIPGSRGASQVIFSPDGEWIAYEAAGKLRKSHIDGSAAMNITDASSNNGADWTSRDEIILGSESSHAGLQRISVNGGQLTQFIKPDSSKGEHDYLWPVTSADGRRVVFVIWKGTLGSAMLASASTDGGEVKPLGLRGIRPVALVERDLIYVQDDGGVMAVKLNRSFDKAEGSPIPVLDPVEAPANLNGNSEIFISKSGGLLTSRGRTSGKLAWFGNDGSITPLSNEVRAYGPPRLSPDEQSIAVAVNEQGNTSIWLYDIGNRTFSKLPSEVTAGPPAWSPNGERIYFPGVDKNLGFGVFVQNANGSSEPQRLIATREPVGGVTVAPDEKSIVFTSFMNNAWKLFRVELGGSSKPELYLNTRGDEWAASFSPDGKWIATVCNEGGRDEVFVRSYPVPSVRIQVSAGEAEDPLWAKDGSAVYYRTGGAIVRATIGKAPATRVIARDTVARSLSGIITTNLVRQYDVSRSGRFLGRASDTGDYQLIAVPNWKAELEQKMARSTRR
jgi:serine/threonine-protein kinase